MNKKITIREYRETDELKWLDVHASVMVDSAAWWIVLHKKPTYKNDSIDLVAIDGDRVVGFITFEINARIVSEIKDCAFVWEFGVHREYRGLEIGRKLIQNAHRLALKKYGIRKSIGYSQEERAQRYYERLGMKEIERHWQFSVTPTKEQQQNFKKDGFDCWDMRGSCLVEDFERVKKKFKIIEDDDALRPRICIGYEYIYIDE